MWVLMLEAAAAALVFIVIVWWTMFCDRPGDEPAAPVKDTPEAEKPGAKLPVDRVDRVDQTSDGANV